MFTALPNYSTNRKKDTKAHDPYNELADVDFEEQRTGYQTAYLRFVASESAISDPLRYIEDPKRRSHSDCRSRSQALRACLVLLIPRSLGRFCWAQI